MSDLEFAAGLHKKTDEEIDELLKKRIILSADKQKFLDYEVQRRDRLKQWEMMEKSEARMERSEKRTEWKGWISTVAAAASALIALMALTFSRCGG